MNKCYFVNIGGDGYGVAFIAESIEEVRQMYNRESPDYDFDECEVEINEEAIIRWGDIV